MKVQAQEPIRAIRIKNAKKRLANFLIALDKRFFYDGDDFYLFGTASEAKIRNYFIQHDMPLAEVEAMEMEEINNFEIF